MRRSFKICIGPDGEVKISRLASEILAGAHGERARQLLEEEIQKATAQTNDLFQKIRLHVEICNNEELLRQILEGGEHA